MFHISRLSKAVYVCLCKDIGSPTELKFRREIEDTLETLCNPVDILRGRKRKMSGSKREGFRLQSDEDYMFWNPNHMVVCDLSLTRNQQNAQQAVILMECDDLPPGFTRLKLMSSSTDVEIVSSSVVKNNQVYISSILYRDYHLQLVQTSIASAIPHGPCCSFAIAVTALADYAFCFWSHQWPTKALPWIQRCRQKGWPSENVTDDILSGGFHVVPIGSTSDNGLEWRISFSFAEQKLVYSMNHCQFLCYGLFKVFLKEVINVQNNTSVLCSYFLKTIVFWVIQTNSSLTWTPENLLSCFWECFKLLIYMVHTGGCPNFFIPQYNMFRVKVTGSVQTLLFSQLYELYCKGIPCLLLSETIRPYFSEAILCRSLRLCTEERSIISNEQLDTSFFRELETAVLTIRSFNEAYMKQAEIIIIERLTPYQLVTLQCLTAEVLLKTTMWIQSRTNATQNRNKDYYKADKVIALVKLACSIGRVTDILHLAMYYYRTRRYEDSLACLQKFFERLSLPYTIFEDGVNLYLLRDSYMEGMPLSYKMKIARFKVILLNCEYTYIDELALEQKICEKTCRPGLLVPSIVLFYILLILNQHRLGDTVGSQQALRHLQALILNEYRICIPINLRDISWQILGICQQICGDYSGSLQSYRYSLQQESINGIQEATLLRINITPHGAI